MDGVDDLYAAEQFAARAADVLARLVAGDTYSWGEARSLVDEWANYCRPTCNPLDEGPHDEVCQEGETCGCPCRSRQPSTTSGL